ncbi:MULTISPECIES: hypothetical protein [unclassified Solwaraspora]|uniref:hypothetical protein n=1 Tax=unclassified Solwaraspora TaxID=2627926 RepID=UPI00259BE641|nr:hypothetical protein [Solwaraspora sp. WMMA2056]WJK43565.1 hypothetical protein O7608_14840 [Solwaraspora sp. WMMA2056]
MEKKVRRAFADYLPEDLRGVEIDSALPVGRPRIGHGIVYVYPPQPGSEEVAWHAMWSDQFLDPDGTGNIVGQLAIEGDRLVVIEWAQSQPAAQKLVFSVEDGEWVDL